MEPLDPNVLPFVELARERDDDWAAIVDGDDTACTAYTAYTAYTDRPHRVWWIVLPTAALVIIGLVVGIVVFDTSATDPVRGSITARDAAQRFVAAINAGDGDAAAAVSCPTFTNGARAVARTGEQGVRFALAGVTPLGADTARALLAEKLSIDGDAATGSQQLNVFRDGGDWLMCGAAN